MLNNILEISQRSNKNGRVPIKIALLKIHDDPKETNKNGIHWKKEYVLNAIDSVKGMPLCCEFVSEDKSCPLGHGLTGEVVDSNGVHEPVFENSDVVGTFEKAEIETIKDINGNEIEALCGYGYLYYQRYPKLVDWVRKGFATGEVCTSIEIMGLKENDNKIIYEDGYNENMRSPMIYCFSGCALLSVAPSDDAAVVLEISQRKTTNKEEKKNMEFDKKEFEEVLKSTLAEINSEKKSHDDEVSELNNKITELNSQIEAKDADIAARDTQIAELNAKVEQMEKDMKKKDDEKEDLEKEVTKAKASEKLSEVEAALKDFSDEEKEVAKEDIKKLKDEINACQKKEELNNVTSEINSIKSKICMEIVARQKQAESEARISEQNSEEVKIEDIFSEVCSEKYVDDDEEVNIF